MTEEGQHNDIVRSWRTHENESVVKWQSSK